jgi:hypothetical protein
VHDQAFEGIWSPPSRVFERPWAGRFLGEGQHSTSSITRAHGEATLQVSTVQPAVVGPEARNVYGLPHGGGTLPAEQLHQDDETTAEISTTIVASPANAKPARIAHPGNKSGFLLHLGAGAPTVDRQFGCR